MTLHCEGCDGYYDLPDAKTENFRLTILFFAQCANCGMLRDERSKHYPYPRCSMCNIPIPDRRPKLLARPGVIECAYLCHAHYVRQWRKSRFMADTLPSHDG